MDENILADLKAGKNHVIEQVYKDCYKMVANYIKNNNGTEDDAKDTFQEAMMVVIKNLRKPNFILTAKLSTYLYSVARQLWLYRLRGKRNYSDLDTLQGKEPFIVLDDDEILRKQLLEKKHDLLKKVFKQIGTDCQKILHAYYYDKIKLKAIAKDFDYTYAFARVKKNRCMKSLMKQVKQDLEYKNLKN